MPYCPRCGTSFKDGDRYCIPCGNKLPENQSLQAETPNVPAKKSIIDTVETKPQPSTTNSWYEGIVQQVESNREELRKSKYKLDLFLRIAKRTDSLAISCSECQRLKGLIERNSDEFGSLQSSGKARSNYLFLLNQSKIHLQKKHKLVPEGKYMRIWFTAGWIFGGFFGLTLLTTGMSMGGSTGIFIGVISGSIIGFMLDSRARKEGKVI